MKKIYYALLLLFAVTVNYAQTQTINSQLKLTNVPQGSASDSILVRGSNGIVKFVKRSSFSSGSAPASDASATVKGVVNNISLQELGGVDKLINGVRIGRGGGNKYGNTAIGDGALFSNIYGAPNTAIGSGALYYNQDGSGNIAVGFNSGGFTLGNRNVFIGNLQGTGITTGNDNLVISQGNGLSNGVTTGSGNTIIGKVTGLANDLANSILITNGIGNVGFSHISGQGTKLPSQTNALINADTSGKAAITKEYLESKELNFTTTLDFEPTPSLGTSQLTITVPGAVVGDFLLLGHPAPPIGGSFTALVGAANTIIVRFYSGYEFVDLPSLQFKIRIFK
jgi:hypothetical protein